MLNDVLKVNDQTIQIDHEGYLLELADWMKMWHMLLLIKKALN